MAYQDGSDLKTFIPGVGFLVTSLETGEAHIFEVPEIDDGAEAQCAQYDEDLLHFEDNIDFPK